MRAGKLATGVLKDLVLSRLGHRRSEVVVHAGVGEDSSVVDLGGDYCVFSTDPITGVSTGMGSLGVHVSCNDVAAMGATPVGVQVSLLMPEGCEEAEIGRIMGEIHEGCMDLGIEVLGGHTEITSKVTAPILTVTALGRSAPEGLVTSAGVKPGQVIIVTKGVGIEGTAILAAEFADRLREGGVTPETLEQAAAFSEQISVVPDALAAVNAGAAAMHDVTEGGLLGALAEMAEASECGFEIWEETLPVHEVTTEICSCLDLDPKRLISSGSLLIATFENEQVLKALAAAGVKAYVIGKACPAHDGLLLRGTDGSMHSFAEYQEDELWRLLRRQ